MTICLSALIRYANEKFKVKPCEFDELEARIICLTLFLSKV